MTLWNDSAKCLSWKCFCQCISFVPSHTPYRSYSMAAPWHLSPGVRVECSWRKSARSSLLSMTCTTENHWAIGPWFMMIPAYHDHQGDYDTIDVIDKQLPSITFYLETSSKVAAPISWHHSLAASIRSCHQVMTWNSPGVTGGGVSANDLRILKVKKSQKVRKVMGYWVIGSYWFYLFLHSMEIKESSKQSSSSQVWSPARTIPWLAEKLLV